MKATKASESSQQLLAMAWINGILIGLIALGLALGLWLSNVASPNALTMATESLTAKALLNYNLISHGVWIAIVGGVLIWLWYDSRQPPQSSRTESPRLRSPLHQIIRQVRLQPIASVVLVVVSLFLINEASWFYKEIIGWYDDINAGNLLQNFSLRSNLISETLTRNDFRFYPLAFADLQILSWFTPYVKVWMIFNVIELITTICLGVCLVRRITKSPKARELLLMFSLLFIATAPSAFSYLQFIYSERILTLLFAVYLWNYLTFQNTRSRRSANIAMAAALLGSFCKDTAILLFAIPAAATVVGGLLVRNHARPTIQGDGWRIWLSNYHFELRTLSLSLFFLVSFLFLTYLPSTIVGEPRYDAELTMNQFEPDARLLFLALFTLWRALSVVRGKNSVTVLDGGNLAVLAYAGALFWLVGYSSSNYMSLPIHFMAVIDLMVIWCLGARPWLQKHLNTKAITAVGFISSAAIIYTELQFPGNAYSRIKKIVRTHHSWEATYNQSYLVLRKAREQGEEVNVIISKSWFRRFNHLKRLHYDRLVYQNEYSHEYLIVDGIDKGKPYSPRKGDYFLDLDTGKKRIKEYDINIKGFEPIYEYSPDVNNGRIYMKRR